jgi:hypothetical protein
VSRQTPIGKVKAGELVSPGGTGWRLAGRRQKDIIAGGTEPAKLVRPWPSVLAGHAQVVIYF